MTRVVHCKKEPYDVYIGRPSKFGNPFVVGVDGTRSRCVEMYAEWVVTQHDLLNDIKSLKGLVLGCWCKKNGNEPCHGDIIARIADKE